MYISVTLNLTPKTRLAVLLASLTPMMTQLEKTPPSWDLEVVSLFPAPKLTDWYHTPGLST